MTIESLSVRTNIDQLKKDLNDVQRKQLPFIIAKTITQTAQYSAKIEKSFIKQRFDKPRPWTTKGVAFLPASKKNWSAKVYVKRNQAQYLFRQEVGGVRFPRSNTLISPGVDAGRKNVRLNRFGNIARRKLKQLLSKPDHFRGSIDNVDGIWKRPRRGKRRDGTYGTIGRQKGLKLVIGFNKVQKYRERFHFVRDVSTTARLRVDKNWAEGIKDL